MQQKVIPKQEALFWNFTLNLRSKMKNENTFILQHKIKKVICIKDLLSAKIKSILDIKGNLKWFKETCAESFRKQKHKIL